MNGKGFSASSIWGVTKVDNLNFLFAAYTAVWVFLFLYVLTLARRNRTLEKEIDELRQLLEQGRAER